MRANATAGIQHVHAWLHGEMIEDPGMKVEGSIAFVNLKTCFQAVCSRHIGMFAIGHDFSELGEETFSSQCAILPPVQDILKA
jgi:hypothetical protein